MDMKAIAMGLVFAFMWSSAFSSARVIVAEAPALAALALRFSLSGLLAVAIAAALGQTWRLTRAQWKATVIFGVCQNALYLGLFFVAMQTIEASLAAIVASSMPLLVAAAGWVGRGERLAPQAVIGLMAGLAGVALILGTRATGGADPFGMALCVVGVLALTVATLSVRSAASGGNVLMIVGLQMLIGSAVLWGPVATLGIPAFDLSPRLILAFVYTLLVPGLAATFVWFLLVNRIGATRAATFHFLNPVFGVAIAAVVLGEKIRALDMLGVVIVTLGILAVQLSKAPKSTVAPRS
jgi:drug/metabolite transporter (DMT)-like permease